MQVNIASFMFNLRWVRRKILHILLFPLFLATAFFLSCSHFPSKELVKREDREWMEKFFHDLLFVEKGAYTLWGSKPITEIALYHFTQDEYLKMLEECSAEEEENCYIQEEYDLPENWERWEQVRSKYPSKKYLLFRSHFSDDRKISYVYFVNILKTAYTIQKNYDLFRANVGFDFHPLDVVYEMPDPTSLFWTNLRASNNSPMLWGILFGYGEENAMAFHWKYFDRSKHFQDLTGVSSHPGPIGKVSISKENFEIPSFISFVNDDKMIYHYDIERKRIKKAYKSKSICELTLSRFTDFSSAPKR